MFPRYQRTYPTVQPHRWHKQQSRPPFNVTAANPANPLSVKLRYLWINDRLGHKWYSNIYGSSGDGSPEWYDLAAPITASVGADQWLQYASPAYTAVETPLGVGTYFPYTSSHIQKFPIGTTETGVFTMAVWFRCLDVSHGQTVASYGSYTAAWHRAINVTELDGGAIFGQVGPHGTGTDVGRVPISSNKYYLAVLTRDGTTSKLYVDGLFRAEASGGAYAPANNDWLWIANLSGAPAWAFNGLIASYMEWRRALTPEEILTLYLQPWSILSTPAALPVRVEDATRPFPAAIIAQPVVF